MKKHKNVCYVKTNILLANVSLDSGLISSHYAASAKKVDGYLSRININKSQILIVQKWPQNKFFKAHFISSSLTLFQKKYCQFIYQDTIKRVILLRSQMQLRQQSYYLIGSRLCYENVTAPVWQVAVMFTYIQYLFPPFSSSPKPSTLINVGPKSWRALHFVEACPFSRNPRMHSVSCTQVQMPTDGDWCVQRFHAAELWEEGKNAARPIPSWYSKKRGGTRPCIRLTVLQELHKNLSLTKAWCLSARNKMRCCLVKLKFTQNFLTSGGFTHEIREKWCSWTPVSQRSMF